MSCPRCTYRSSRAPEGSRGINKCTEGSESIYDQSAPVDNVLVDWCGNTALPEVKLRFRVQRESNTSKFLMVSRLQRAVFVYSSEYSTKVTE